MPVLSSHLYDRDVLLIKRYGNYKVKVIMLSSCRVSGFEIDQKVISRSSVNTSKLDKSLIRSRSRIYEYAMCNEWQYFCTFTLNKEKYDRYNLDVYHKDFSEFIHNLNRRRKNKITYLLIPEMHKDGAWHMHGLINGLIDSDLIPTCNICPETGKPYLTWQKYNFKFGFMSLDSIRHMEATAKYCTKYISKDISKSVTELGAHVYYASHGLKTAEKLYKGHGNYHGDWDYIHPDGYVKVKTLDLRETTIEECIEVMQ